MLYLRCAEVVEYPDFVVACLVIKQQSKLLPIDLKFPHLGPTGEGRVALVAWRFERLFKSTVELLPRS